MEQQPNKIEKKDTVYINLFGEINPTKVGQIMSICTNVIGRYNPSNLYFMFSSSGGDVTSGITLFNFLKSLPLKIIMHNIGSIDSIATVIFLSGSERYAVNNSSFLFHGVGVNVAQGANFNLNTIQEIESRLKIDQDKISGIVEGISKMTKEEMSGLFNKGESKKLDFALDKGIINEIRECKVPNGEIIISIS